MDHAREIYWGDVALSPVALARVEVVGLAEVTDLALSSAMDPARESWRVLATKALAAVAQACISTFVYLQPYL